MISLEEEKKLIEGLANEKNEAIETIYREHYSMVQYMVVKNNGTSDDAADIFQETMIVLYEKAISGSFDLQCQLKTFIYSVSRRLWLKKLQQTQRSWLNSGDVENTVAVEADMEHHEEAQKNFNLMETAMAKVGEPCKSLLNAYYLQKKSMQDIADDFGYTNADNAKTQKYKCLVRLKKLFFAQYKNAE